MNSCEGVLCIFSRGMYDNHKVLQCPLCKAICLLILIHIPLCLLNVHSFCCPVNSPHSHLICASSEQVYSSFITFFLQLQISCSYKLKCFLCCSKLKFEVSCRYEFFYLYINTTRSDRNISFYRLSDPLACDFGIYYGYDWLMCQYFQIGGHIVVIYDCVQMIKRIVAVL